MMHFKYLRDLLRHKWFVFVECCKLGIPWLGIIHDWSKFRPSEWIPYARHFHGDYPSEYDLATGGYNGKKDRSKESIKTDFDVAWLHHQRRNKHHWQYWLLVQDSDPDKIIAMPDKYRREMLADWRGASRTYTGGDNTRAWYLKRCGKWEERLNPETQAWIEKELAL